MQIKIGKKIIKNFGEPYIIAEIASNHNGDMEIAKKLIKAAKTCGADCVKFQSWTKDSIFCRKSYEDNYFLQDDYRNRTDYTMEEIVDKHSISESQLSEMKVAAKEYDIDFTSTPFCEKEVDYLTEQLKAPFIKIASMDVNNYPFLTIVAKKRIPIILSTGLSELYEIDKAINTIEKAGNKDIILLHCISNYPPKDEEVHLNKIDTLRCLYPYPIGFSDHTIGYSIPLAAVAKGACVLEKHITLDSDMPGWDHKISATPSEFQIICTQSKRISRALGSNRMRCVEDQEKKEAFRRSIVTKNYIKKGQLISEKDLTFKRPGTGIPPEAINWVVGRKAKKNIRENALIFSGDLY